MQYNNNNRIDLNTHASRNNNITFSSTITVGKYNCTNKPNALIPRHLEPINFNNRPINPTTALFKDTPWRLQPKKIKHIAMATTNIYENLEDDDLDEYGDYTKPWKLDCAATGYFAGEHTGILKRKDVENGFDAMVANGDKITQTAAGIVPFNVPAAAAHVAVFKNIPTALLAAGPLVKSG